MTLSVLQDLPILEPVVSPDVSSSSFRCVEVVEHISLLPCYVGRLSQGIIEHLNEKVFRFSSQLRGTVLSYSKPLVLQRHGAILDEQPHLHFDLKYSVYLFKPVVGSLMCGVVNNVGQDYIGCLVYKCFNASVLAPGSAEHQSSWYSEPFDIGSTVWFRVVALDNVGGVVSITGEYYDMNIASGLAGDQVGTIESDSGGVKAESSKKLKKHKHKKKERFSDAELTVSETDVSSAQNRNTLKKSKHKAKHSDVDRETNDEVAEERLNSGARKKKRKRESDSEDAVSRPKRTQSGSENTLSMQKRTRTADHDSTATKQKKKKSKHKL